MLCILTDIEKVLIGNDSPILFFNIRFVFFYFSYFIKNDPINFECIKNEWNNFLFIDEITKNKNYEWNPHEWNVFGWNI